MSDVHDYLAARRDYYPCTNCGGKGRHVEAWLDGTSELTCDECRGKGTVPFTPMQVEVLANYEIKIVCGRETYWIDLKSRKISSNGRPRTRKGAYKSPPLNLPPNWTIEEVLIEICRMKERR